MVSDIELLEAVCERMQQVGLVQSKAEFSTRMLGKGPSYLTSMSARDRKVPDEVMAFFESQLQADIADDENTIADLSSQLAQRERSRAHRADLQNWIMRHRVFATDSAFAAGIRASVKSPSIQQKLIAWLTGSRPLTSGVLHSE